MKTSTKEDIQIVPVRPSTSEIHLAALKDRKGIAMHNGTVTFSFDVDEDGVYGNQPRDVIGWRPWTEHDTIDDMLHSDFDDIVFRAKPQPRPADAYNTTAVREVKLAGGPCALNGDLIIPHHMMRRIRRIPHHHRAGAQCGMSGAMARW